jgi:hypothetical protein
MIGLMGIMFGLSIVYLISRLMAMSRRVSQLERQVKDGEAKNAPDEQAIASIIQDQLRVAIERAVVEEPTPTPPPAPRRMAQHPLHAPPHGPAFVPGMMPPSMPGMHSPPAEMMEMLMQDMFRGGFPGGGVVMMQRPVEELFDANNDEGKITEVIELEEIDEDEVVELNELDREKVKVENESGKRGGGEGAATEKDDVDGGGAGAGAGGAADDDGVTSMVTSAMAPFANVVDELEYMQRQQAAENDEDGNTSDTPAAKPAVTRRRSTRKSRT